VVVGVFGSPVGAAGPTPPGLLSGGDARLVALPVPTLRKTFAWVTSVVALGRLVRKYRALAGSEGPTLPAEPGEALSSGHGWVGDQVFGPLVLAVDGTPSGTPNRLLMEWAANIRTADFAAEDALQTL